MERNMEKDARAIKTIDDIKDFLIKIAEEVDILISDTHNHFNDEEEDDEE